MKKITLLLIILCTVNAIAQVTEKYHRVKRVYTDGSAIQDFCLNGTTSTLDRKLNILIVDRFPVGTTFYYNFGGGTMLWAVTYSSEISTSDQDFTINGDTITVHDICSYTYKYHRFYYLGTTALQAQEEYCSIATNSNDAKVDILTLEPLTADRVYYVDRSLNTYPPGYYYLKFSYYYDSSDEDDMLEDPTLISPVIFPDSDNDGIIDECDNNRKYHILKYRGQTQEEAESSKCNNDTENSVGVNIKISQKLTVGRIYNIDRGTGIGHRYYEVTSAQDNANPSASTTIDYTNIGSSFIADCSVVELADIEITNLRILRNGSTEIYNSDTNSTPILSNNNSYEFIYTIENSGGEGINVNLAKFFSYNSTFDNYNDYFIDEDEVSLISPGGQTTFRTNITPNNNYIGLATVSNGQGYYFIFSVVYESSNSSVSDYINSIGFIFSTNTSSKTYLMPYQLEAYDFLGNQVSSEIVSSKEEESEVLRSLPRGSYIIKANDKTYKISKD